MSDAPVGTNARVSQIAANAASLLTSEVLNKATTFAIYAIVARHLGTREFGQLSLGLLLLYTCQVFANAGLPALVTREVAKRRRHSARYFVNATIVATVSSLIATLGMVLFGWGMQYDADTLLVISLLSLGLLPFGLASVVEAIFRGWEEMHWIAFANVPINIAKVIVAFYLLHAGHGVLGVAILLVVCRIGIVLAEWAFYFWRTSRAFDSASVRFCVRMLSRSSTFLGLDGIIAVWASVNAVLLSKFFSEIEAGLYVAAHQLLQPALLAYQSVVGSMFPAMCKRAISVHKEVGPLIRWIVDLLLFIGLPVAIALYFLAGDALLLLYGDPSFQAATSVVQLLAVVLLLRALTNALGHAMWAGAREVATLRIVMVNLAVNLLVGFILIPRFGLVGAGLTALITWSVNAGQHYLACQRMIEKPPVGPQAWKLSAAACAMVLCVLWFRESVFTGVLIGTGVYVALAGGLLVASHGGPAGFRSQFFAPLLKP